MKAAGCGISKLTPNNKKKWAGHEFFIDEDVQDCDAWFIWDGLAYPDSTCCPADHVVFITGEPEGYKCYHKDWLNKFPHIITCQRGIRHPSVCLSQTGMPWFINKSYDDLAGSPFPVKTKELSAIFSAKTTIKGHRDRLRFLLAFAKRKQFDCYGRKIESLLHADGIKAQYYFSQEVETNNKWPGLADYRYSIAIENCSSEDYWTEKIIDCFLAGTVPVYYGCPNIEHYFPRDSYISIDIHKPEEAYSIIESTCSESDYLRRLPALQESKRRVLEDYNLFNVITQFSSRFNTSKSKQLVSFEPEPQMSRWQKKIFHLKHKLPFSM